MHDQAEKLRIRMRRYAEKKEAKTIAFISGKGGVGKSNLSLNFSIALAKLEKKVLLIDMDIGMGNIDVLAGIQPEKNVAHFFTENETLERIIEKGPENISFIAGGNGLTEFVKLNEARMNDFLREIRLLTYDYDFFIFDFGAGMDEEVVKFLATIDSVFVVVTPDPTSIMDAYSAMKYLLIYNRDTNLYLVGNRMKNSKENETVLSRINQALKIFLQKEGIPLGFIPEDSAVSKSVLKQSPFLVAKPYSNASRQMQLLAKTYLEQIKMAPINKEKPARFLEHLKSFISVKR